MENFENVKDQKFDGFIITGAPVEQIPLKRWITGKNLEDHGVDKDTCYFNDPSLLGHRQALYYHYGINKVQLDKKLSVSLNIRL